MQRMHSMKVSSLPSETPRSVDTRVSSSDETFLLVEEKKEEPLRTGKGVMGPRGRAQYVETLPKQLNTTPAFRQVLRYYVSATTTLQPITVSQLGGACGGIATAATTFAPWASSVRLHKLTVYPSPTSSGAVPTLTGIVWASGASSGYLPDEEVEATLPSGVTQTHAAVFRPPKGSLAAMWISSQLVGSSNVLALSCVIGSVIEVDISSKMSNNLAAFSTQSPAGKTVGNAYWPPLDGYTTTKFPPLGRPQ
jgi:hypothetical protein